MDGNPKLRELFSDVLEKANEKGSDELVGFTKAFEGPATVSVAEAGLPEKRAIISSNFKLKVLWEEKRLAVMANPHREFFGYWRNQASSGMLAIYNEVCAFSMVPSDVHAAQEKLIGALSAMVDAFQ